jgi:hypothetical protein
MKRTLLLKLSTDKRSVVVALPSTKLALEPNVHVAAAAEAVVTVMTVVVIAVVATATTEAVTGVGDAATNPVACLTSRL